MTSERWQQIKAVLEDALDHEALERKAFLDTACQGDDDLRREVEVLLAAEDGASDFIETPVFRFRLNDTAPLAEGQRVGAYRIVHEIGRGGMGSVYLAERADEFHRKVALKVVRRGMDTDEILRRFRWERQILAHLDHENIAKLFDGGTTEDGRPYFAMEYVEGRPIHEYCDAHKLTTRQRLELFREVCTAVHFAHQNLVVHRDLKPGNILVTSEGVPKLLDFGIAKLVSPGQESATVTQADLRAMTPEYASPEQVRGEPITTASDIYSLGVLLYKLLTGHAPYRSDTQDPQRLIQVICDTDPTRPSIVINKVEEVVRADGSTIRLTPESVSQVRDGEPRALRRQLAGDLDTIVLKAMHKDPQRRYASVDQLSNDIARYLDGLPVIAQKDSLRYRMGKFVSRHRLGVSVAALVTLIIGGAGISWQRAIFEKERAEREETRAEVIAQFLRSLFEVSNPSESRGTEITARQMLDSGVSKIREQLANQPELLADLMDSMGKSYRGLGLYDSAIKLHREALRLRRQSLGDENVLVAESLHNLGTALRHIGEDEEAARLFREGLEIWRGAGQTRSTNYAAALTNLGSILEEKRQYAEAENLYKESLALKLELEGEDPVNIGRSYNNLGKLYYNQGKYQAAEENYRKALSIYKQAVPDEPDPDMAVTLNNLGTLRESQGDLVEAEALLRQSLAMRQKLYGYRNPGNLSSFNNLALLLLSQGKPTEAEPLMRDALSLADEVYEKEHFNRGVFMSNLAMILAAQGKGKEGETLAREALAILQAADRTSWRNFAVQSILGSCLTAQGRYPEAEPLLLKGYDSLRKEKGSKDEYTVAARERLFALYTAWKKPEKAAEYRAGA